MTLEAVTLRLSIVTSLYKSADFIREFHRRVSETAAQVTTDWELIMVNDGSPDKSLQIAIELQRRDPHTRVVDLSRNFGHHKALMTGLGCSRGDLIFVIDSDLEEDPAWLPIFLEAMASTGAESIYGVQRSRKGGWFERMSGALFYRIFNKLLTHPFPPNIITARLMTRQYVDALVQHREQEVSLAGLCTITGFEQRPLTLDKGTRGDTSYGLRRRISAFVTAITSFSNRPLLYIFQLGVGVILLSIAAGIVLMYQSMTGRIGVPGWASIMVSIWFLGGVMIFCVGVLGIYLAKVFTETKDRPYTIIRRIYGTESDTWRSS
ncbi:MAG TPA: glycosyltransferase family 2 protein [Vicinamibacterales bacterium]|nr:glycosyltransferase family 2 protein [Vicinamibacterales bacterium]